jgi:hypothetical protein
MTDDGSPTGPLRTIQFRPTYTPTWMLRVTDLR